VVDRLLWARLIAGLLSLLLFASCSRGDRGDRRDTPTVRAPESLTPVPAPGGMGGGGAAGMRIGVGPSGGMGGGGAAAPKDTP
jgi:hypothetical protein